MNNISYIQDQSNHDDRFDRNFINKYVPSKYLNGASTKGKKDSIPKYINHVLTHVLAGDKEIIKHYIILILQINIFDWNTTLLVHGKQNIIIIILKVLTN